MNFGCVIGRPFAWNSIFISDWFKVGG